MKATMKTLLLIIVLFTFYQNKNFGTIVVDINIDKSNFEVTKTTENKNNFSFNPISFHHSLLIICDKNESKTEKIEIFRSFLACLFFNTPNHLSFFDNSVSIDFTTIKKIFFRLYLQFHCFRL